MPQFTANFLDETIKRTCSGVSTKLTGDEVLIIDALVEFRRRRGLTEGKSHLTRQMIQFAFDHKGKTFKVPETKEERAEFNDIIQQIYSDNQKDNEQSTNTEQSEQPSGNTGSQSETNTSTDDNAGGNNSIDGPTNAEGIE